MVDNIMNIPDDIIIWENIWFTIPNGYKKVHWNDISETKEVFTIGKCNNKDKIFGPFFVSNAKKLELKDKNGIRFIDHIDGLLLKDE